MAEDLQILVKFKTKLPKELRVPEAAVVRSCDVILTMNKRGGLNRCTCAGCTRQLEASWTIPDYKRLA